MTLNHYQLKEKLERYQKLRAEYLELELELFEHMIERSIIAQYDSEHWED